MKWLKLSKDDLFNILNIATMVQLQTITGYQKGLISHSKYPQPRKNKMDMINLLTKLIHDSDYKTKFYNELCATPESKELYYTLLWKQKEIDVEEAESRFGLNFGNAKYTGYNDERLSGAYSLIYKTGYWSNKVLYIHERVRPILKLIHPLPDDFELSKAETIEETQYAYSNESNILGVISTIEEMLKANLVKFGKNGEKPLAQTLNILKSTTPHDEFYPAKSMNNLSIDMLTRSFSFYYWENHSFKKAPLETLRKFINMQLNDAFNYTISRLFLSHIRKVRFGKYSDGQMDLFNTVQLLIDSLPKDGWVDFDSIIRYCNYRDFRIDLESHYATKQYYMNVNAKEYHYGDDRIYAEDDYYNQIIFEPMLKGVFFYLGALGVLELKYDDPVSPHPVKAKGKAYISMWDGLKYVKLTPLGRYVFGFEAKYTPKKSVQKASTVKFDEYKPIIAIDANDTIMRAKLEPYTEKYDSNRYILNYSKIFRDCKTGKMLEAKIDKFYTLFGKPVPPLYDNYFDEITARSNMLKRESRQIVIELKNDKKLLNLFMENKKLQELVIKASGYRIIVSKDDLPKLTKIVKDNGFFVEF